MVALPALANVNSDDSDDFNTNNAMKTKNSNDSRDDKKISLSGYYPAKLTHRQIVEGKGIAKEHLGSA